MSKNLAQHAKNAQRKSDRAQRDQLTPQERKALATIQQEAKERGCFLTSGGKGGLPPQLVLDVFRRDKWRCKVCSEKGTKENGGLGVHHKYQHITDPKARAKGVRAIEEGRRNDASQLNAICARCHDNVHERDRDEHGGEDADEVVDGKK